MGAARLVPLVAAALLFAGSCAAKAQTADPERLYAEGVAARKAGNSRAAVERFRSTLALQPRNVDARLQLGLSLTAERRFAEARRELNLVLAAAPAYHDARLALARVALFEGNLPRAAAEFETFRKNAPNHPEAAAFAASLAAAQEDARRPAETPRLWRLDVDGTWTDLSGGQEPWREGRMALGYRLDPQTGIAAGVEAMRRFGRVDVTADVRIDRAWTEGFSTYLRLGGTPDADFRPRWLVGTGLAFRLAEGNGAFGATTALVDLGHAEYRTGGVHDARLGLRQDFLDGRLGITVQAIAAQHESDRARFGFAVRLDWSVTDSLALFAGYSDAPDVEAGSAVGTRTLFGGLNIALNEAVTLRLAASREDRETGSDRTSLTLGLTTRF